MMTYYDIEEERRLARLEVLRRKKRHKTLCNVQADPQGYCNCGVGDDIAGRK